MKILTITIILLLYSLRLGATEQPSRFAVSAGFVPIDDGSYHVVILMDSSSSPTPEGYLPKYCGAGWSVGFVETEFKDKSKAGVVTTNPSGCWAASGSNPKKDIITFRYFSISENSVREFTIEPFRMKRMLYEWRTERLYPFPKSP